MDETVSIDREICDPGAGTREELACFENCGMLNRGRDDMAWDTVGANRSDKREVVSLGAAGREDDLLWFGANQRCDLFSSFVDRSARDSSCFVQARGIAISFA